MNLNSESGNQSLRNLCVSCILMVTLSSFLTLGKLATVSVVLKNVDRLHRYRNIPPFGRSTIRRFHNNASQMKKLAGRDFEDLLQVWNQCI